MLPVRDGVGASCVSLPPGHWRSLIDFLVFRFPAIPEAEWRDRMRRGDVVDSKGEAVGPEHAYRPHRKLFYYRSLPFEAPIAVQEKLLFEDELLVVADKPHFLPVTPSGRYLQQTLLVRLRKTLGLDELTPVHRIDRETAGVVLFVKQAATRKLYHALFAGRAVHKVYEAIAPLPPTHLALRFPYTHRSKLEGTGNFMQMREGPGGVGGSAADASSGPGASNSNKATAQTTIELLEVQGDLARYRLLPLTGQRHQLRVHMAALGMPIVGDRIYPVHLADGSDDPDNPLGLLAQSLSFRDPVTGLQRQFNSLQTLIFPV